MGGKERGKYSFRMELPSGNGGNCYNKSVLCDGTAFVGLPSGSPRGKVLDGLRRRQAPKPLRCVDVRHDPRHRTSRRHRDSDRSLQLQGQQQARNPRGIGMKKLKFGERQPVILELGGRMRIGVPLDERRTNSFNGKRPIRGDGNQPVECAATHGFDVSERFGGCGRRCLNVGGTDHPSGQPRRRLAAERVERKPAWPGWRRRRWIGRDKLKEQGLPKPQKQIVCSHPRVLSARLRRNTKNVAHKCCTGLK